MNYVELSPSELVAAMNWLNQNQVNKLDIETPWSTKPILSMGLAESTTDVSLSIKSAKSDYIKVTFDKGVDISTVDCAFFASGIVQPLGWNELTKEIEEIQNRNLLQGNKPRRIVLDTVALNRRYFSIIENQLSSQAGTRESGGWGVSYLTTTGILRELARYDRKYRPEQIGRLSEEMHKDWFDWKEFSNQLMSKDRQIRLGDVEGKKMCNSGRCIRESSRVGDDGIIEALERHVRYNKEEILAVSEDTDFVSKCKSYEITALRLDRGHLPNSPIQTRWIQTCDLMYVLSVTLGVIRLKWDGSWLLLQGIWLGKKEESWNQEHVRLSSGNRSLMKWLADFRAIAA